MQNLVPQFILEKYAAGESQGTFKAVSLFADISGFSTVTHTLIAHGSEAAEAMAAIMSHVFAPLVDAVYAQGGFITTFAGDAFTALFPHDQRAAASMSHALAAALAIHEHLRAHPVQETRYGRFPFAVKVGMGEGEVVWGILRPDEANADKEAAYYFSGPAIEAAASAEHHAQPGNIILSPDVHAALGEDVTVLPVGEAGFVRLLSAPSDLPTPRPLPAPETRSGQESFIPKAILIRQTQGEFRQVVSVFVNLMGIHNRDDLAWFMQAVFALREGYGGFLARVDFGDKGCNLLLFWGMPTSTENDIERALGFIQDLGDHTPGSYKAGVTYHPMYAGMAGSARHGEYTAYGGGVSYAARLMVAAPWGSIWLDERVAQRSGGRFVIEDAGKHRFKGFADPQPVYTLMERQDAEAGAFFQGAFVGRDRELARLRAFVQPLFAPEADGRFTGILAVEGEAGLGKSRLVNECLTALSEEQSLLWCLCQCDQTMQKPLNPFRYWLRRYFNQDTAASSTRNKRTFGRKLDQVLATVPDKALHEEINRGRSLLGAMVDLHWENSLYTQLDPQGRYDRALSALKALILAESLRQPVILNVEDVQWLDEASLDFLGRLVSGIERHPIAILTTARPRVGDASLFGEIAYERLPLTYLAKEDVQQLAEALLGAPVAPNVIELLIEHISGNPFFAEQTLLYLQEEGELVKREGVWQLAEDRPEATLPTDIRAIFNARLDRLQEDVREVVQTAAILGREFEIQILTQLRHDEEDVVRKVQSAEEEAIWTSLSQMRYIFKHALLRDAAYDMQLQARRRELHHRAAQSLETIHADELPQHYRDIAHHYEAACRQGLEAACMPARRALQESGTLLTKAYENAAAADCFSRALDLTPEEDEPARYTLLLEREALYHMLGQRKAQVRDLAVLQALVDAWQRPKERAEVALRWARYDKAIGDSDEAIAAAQRTIAAAQTAGDVHQEAKAYLLWAEVAYHQAKPEIAKERAAQALTLSRAIGARHTEANSLFRIGQIAAIQGDMATAEAHYQQAQTLCSAMGDLRGQAHILENLGMVAETWRQSETAQAYYRQALRLFREIGDRSGESSALTSLGFSMRAQTDYKASADYLEQALAIRREIGEKAGIAQALFGLSMLAVARGELIAARDQLEQTLALYQEVGHAGGQVLYGLGEVAHKLGDYETARHYYEQSLAIRREAGSPWGQIGVLQRLSQTALAQGQNSQARDYAEESLTITGDVKGRLRSWRAAGLVALADARVGLGEAAQALEPVQQALTLYRELKSPDLIIEALAVLARAHLAQDQTAEAITAVAEVLDYLAQESAREAILNALDEPVRIYVICYQALQTAEDPRAGEVLQTARALLEERAARITEADARRSYLDHVPWHREALAATGGTAPAAAPPASPVAAPAATAETATTVETTTPPTPRASTAEPRSEDTAPTLKNNAKPTRIKLNATGANVQILERLLTAAARSGAVVIINIDQINVYGGGGIAFDSGLIQQEEEEKD